MDFLQCLMDSSSHAIFTLDQDGIITHINQQTKVRFGLYHDSQHPHLAGWLEPGDLVLIVDTAIDADDGTLRPEDLARIGIREPRFRVSDRLVAAGVFDMSDRRPVYKFPPDQGADSLCLETVCGGIPIRLSIERRSVTVTARDTVYTIEYFRCIGRMVVLDRATGRVKLWQEKGYSARREGAGHLLRGGSYGEKRAGLSLQVEGYYFRDFPEGAQFERDLARVLNGQAPRLEDRECEINGFELVATLLPVPGAGGGRPDGVIVKFRNTKGIYVTILECNNTIKMAEWTYRETARKDAPQEASFTERFGFDTLSVSVRHRVCKLSQLDCGTLITGESGTRESLLAQAIRQTQSRRGPFVTMDRATISPTLSESEMFSYVGGAFTGANPQGKAGFFEAVDGGIVFLGETGEISLQIQVKLLSVIQNKVVCRVGSTRSMPVDVRILAATDRDLRAEAAAGRFRQDLYYRLSAFSTELPLPRSYSEDMCFLIDRPMEKIPQKYGVPPRSLPSGAFNKLLAYNWPSNIRELENVLENAVALFEPKLIYAEHIHLKGTVPAPPTLREWLKREERQILRQTLAQCSGSRVRVMELLGPPKIVFHGKLKEYQLD